MLNEYRRTPDSKQEKGFWIGDERKFFLKTIVYSSVFEDYLLEENSSVFYTNDSSQKKLFELDGVIEMPFNNSSSELPCDLSGLFNAINQESVCVSNLGNRMIVHRPERVVWSWVVEDSSMDKVEEQLAGTCG